MTEEPKHYRLHAETAHIDSKEVEVPLRVKAEEVIDRELDHDTIQGWFDEAGVVRTLQGLQEVIERRLGDFSYTVATTPLAYASIALAALKLANESKHGKLNDYQKEVVLGVMMQALGVEQV